jgi:hypothetical protein
MKSNLKRIEQTLRKLPQAEPSVLPESAQVRTASLEPRSRFFELKPRSVTQAAPPEAASASAPVTPFPVVHPPEEPSLPRFKTPSYKTPSFTNHRNGTNPALAANLLRDILTTVEGWQQELIGIGRQMQDLYLQGPIVDGWLECDGDIPPASAGAAQNGLSSETLLFRHADIEQLVKFAEKLIAGEIQPERVPAEKTGYRLCGLNLDGRVWSCPCPAEQVPAVSLAIARHHQLRQLRIRQQNVETRLAQLSENLVRLHGQLQD